MRIYDYIFFKSYQIGLLFDESPTFGTLIVLCWLFLFNLFTLTEYVLEDLGIDPLANKLTAILTTVLIIIGHFLYFYRKKKYLAIYDKFKAEKKISRILGTIGVLTYGILTVWFTFKYTVPHVELTRGN